MSRWILLAALASASGGLADEGARIAAHPLDARELTVEQREWLKAFFDVRLARTRGVQLAGSNRVDDALRTAKGKDCETDDNCLRYLAESTGSLYAVYARLRREPQGGELLMTARVVRADGAVVKDISRRAHPEKNVDLTETCRSLVASTVDGLELTSLPHQLPKAVSLDAALPPPPLLTVPPPLLTVPATAAPAGMSVRTTAGIALASVGLATLATGAVFFGMAADGRAKLTPDATGAVPRSQVARAGDVALQGRASSVLIPAGAIIGAGGALLALWPGERGTTSLSLAGSSEGGVVVLAGQLP